MQRRETAQRSRKAPAPECWMQPKQVGIEKIKYESDLAVHDRMKFVDCCCLSLMTKRQPPSIGGGVEDVESKK